jgi:hypothetical protein
VLLTTELRVSGRDGRDGAVEVEVAGLAAEGEVVVMAVEVAGLPAVGALDSAFPMKSIRNPGKMRLKRGLVHIVPRPDEARERLTTCACSLPRFWRRYRRHNRVQRPSIEE